MSYSSRARRSIPEVVRGGCVRGRQDRGVRRARPELGAPDDLEQVIVDFIGGAKQSLDIAVQEIDSEPIAQAILDARWRGVAVDCSSSRTICAGR